MKKLKFITIAAALLAVATFSGCKKDTSLMDSTMTPGVAGGSLMEEGDEVPGVTTAVNYSVTTLTQSPAALITWHEGDMSISELILEGDNGSGTPVSMVTPIVTSHPLFDPASFGAVAARVGKYTALVFKLHLTARAGHSLELTGNYHMDGTAVPVHVMIEDEVMWTGKLPGPFALTDDRTYSANMLVDLDRLNVHVTDEMLRNAFKDAKPGAPFIGTIEVSSTTNSDIYLAILRGLVESSLAVKFL